MRSLIQFKVGDWVVPREDRKKFWNSLNEGDGPYLVLKVIERKGWHREHAFQVRCNLRNCQHEYAHNQTLVLQGLRRGKGGACATFFRKLVSPMPEVVLGSRNPAWNAELGGQLLEVEREIEEPRPTRKFRKVL